MNKEYVSAERDVIRDIKCNLRVFARHVRINVFAHKRLIVRLD